MTNIGKIFVSSWGYEQTNVDFYLVVAETAKTVTLQKIGATEVPSEGFAPMAGKKMPKPEVAIGAPMRGKRVSDYGSIKLTSYSRAYPWDGTPHYFSSYA